MLRSQALAVAIEATHAAIAEHPDPQAKALLSQCLNVQLKVQQMDSQHAQTAQSAQQAGPPGPPQGAQDPRQALMAQLGG